jgi:hypothetical protein
MKIAISQPIKSWEEVAGAFNHFRSTASPGEYPEAYKAVLEVQKHLESFAAGLEDIPEIVQVGSATKEAARLYGRRLPHIGAEMTAVSAFCDDRAHALYAQMCAGTPDIGCF